MANYIFCAIILASFSLHVSGAIDGLGYVTKFGDNKHYWELTQPKTQGDAEEFCKSIGFELVQFDSVEELEHLASRLGSNDYWTSGLSISTVKKFHWDLAWNQQNPVAMDVSDITSYSGVYLQRTGRTLRITERTVHMRPLCQHVVYTGECLK